MSTRDILILLIVIAILATGLGVDWRITSPIGLILVVLVILVLVGWL